MDCSRRTTSLRRVAMMAALAALLVPASAAEAKTKAKSPVITKVTPMSAKVGQTLTISGKYFRKGKRKNSVGFKIDGHSVVFAKSDVSTERRLYVKVPSRLQPLLFGHTVRVSLRVLSSRFGKTYTSKSHSPLISPKPAKSTTGGTTTGSGTTTPVTTSPDPVSPEADCDADGVKNGLDADDDNDLLPDTLEQTIGTDACLADSDGDGIDDGYEYRSAIDLNDDEYQQPDTTLAAPMPLGYPNALLDDAAVDYDGDGLPLAVEYKLWKFTTPTAQRTLTDIPGRATPLNYSDGMKYSVSRRCVAGDTAPECLDGSNTHVGRRIPTLTPAGYDKALNFDQWLHSAGYAMVWLHNQPDWYGHSGEWFKHSEERAQYSIYDVDRSDTPTGTEGSLDADGNDYLSDAERDEDADGLSNFDEFVGAMQPGYWSSCYGAEPAYPVSYPGTDPVVADTDGDGVRDGADDQDHDDVPNMMELSRFAASHLNDTDGHLCTPDPDLDPKAPNHPSAYGFVNPFNPCLPDYDSRTCSHVITFGKSFAPLSGPVWWALQ